MSRLHNDANVLCLSADLLGDRLVNRMVEIWLKTDFEGGRHARRLEKIAMYESQTGVGTATRREPLRRPHRRIMPAEEPHAGATVPDL